MIRDFTPILVGKVLPPHHSLLTTVPSLEPARAQPCEVGMDDTADWMHSGGREILEGMLVCECPEAQS
jgi:hypothetical protein